MAIGPHQPIFARMDQVFTFTTSRAAMMAMYKEHGTLDPLRSPAAVVYRQTFRWMLGSAAGLFMASMLWPAVEWLFVLASMVLVGAVLLVVHTVFHLLKARVAIGRWATEMEKAGPVTLTVGEQGFQYEQDGKSLITPWSAVASTQLYTDHIVLDGKERFLFAKHAMPENEFEELVRIVRAKTLAGGA